jgi:hypothetical protein
MIDVLKLNHIINKVNELLVEVSIIRLTDNLILERRWYKWL